MKNAVWLSMILTWLAAVVWSAAAADTPQPAPPAKPDTVVAERDYYKAAYLAAKAQLDLDNDLLTSLQNVMAGKLQTHNARRQQAQDALQKACGAGGGNLSMLPDGTVECSMPTPAPAPAATPVTPPAPKKQD